jgi:hypothetical protein
MCKTDCWKNWHCYNHSAWHAVVPKLLWICTQVKVEVINNKTTWVRVKSTGGKAYLSKKFKVSLKNTWSKK